MLSRATIVKSGHIANFCLRSEETNEARNWREGMNDLGASPYLLSPARALREVCHEIARDGDRRVCADCPVADLCEREARARKSRSGER